MEPKKKTTRKRKPVVPVARVSREGFRFVSETGYRTVIRGPREAIRQEMVRLLPAWLRAALDNGHEQTANVLTEALVTELPDVARSMGLSMPEPEPEVLSPTCGTGKFRLHLVANVLP